MSDFWTRRWLYASKNTPADLAVSRQELARKGITNYSEWVVFAVDMYDFPPQTPPPAKWWESLPPAPARTPIRARFVTTIYKDKTRTASHSIQQPGDVIDYWGRHEDGWLVVYAGATLTLWAWGDDFEKV